MKYGIFYTSKRTNKGNPVKYAESDWFKTAEEAIEVMNSSFPSDSKVLAYGKEVTREMIEESPLYGSLLSEKERNKASYKLVAYHVDR